MRRERRYGRLLLLAGDGTERSTTPITLGRPTPRPQLVRTPARVHTWGEAVLAPLRTGDGGL